MSTTADIFLSYSRDEQSTARLFAEGFEAAGFSVWWDVTLKSGEDYGRVTEEALRGAKAVVVLWSAKSVESRWVRTEATIALQSKTLVPVMITPCQRPIMFELTQTADLSHWNGDANDSVWLTFLHDVQQFVQRGSAAQVSESPTLTPVSPPPTPRRPPSAAQRNAAIKLWSAVLIAVIGTAALMWLLQPSAGNTEVQRIAAQIPATPETPAAFFEGFALSPDGSMLAYSARSTTGLRQIWIRELDKEGARPLSGTEDGTYPFWSPDGRSIAYFAGKRLMRVDIDGSRLQTICEVPTNTFITGSWGRSGDIVWAWSNDGHIYKVPSTGGKPVLLEALGTGMRPIWLADGERFLYTKADNNGTSMHLASADGTDIQLVSAQVPELFTYSAGLLFFNQDNALMGQRFDEAAGSLVGTPVPLTQYAGNPLSWYAVSTNGQRLVGIVGEGPTSRLSPGSAPAQPSRASPGWIARVAPSVCSVTRPTISRCNWHRTAPAQWPTFLTG